MRRQQILRMLHGPSSLTHGSVGWKSMPLTLSDLAKSCRCQAKLVYISQAMVSSSPQRAIDSSISLFLIPLELGTCTFTSNRILTRGRCCELLRSGDLPSESVYRFMKTRARYDWPEKVFNKSVQRIDRGDRALLDVGEMFRHRCLPVGAKLE